MSPVNALAYFDHSTHRNFVGGAKIRLAFHVKPRDLVRGKRVDDTIYEILFGKRHVSINCVRDFYTLS